MINTVHIATTVFLLWCVFTIWLLTPGCNLFDKPNEIEQKADKYHEIIKLIVTDPLIHELLTPDQLAYIHTLDSAYKLLRSIKADLDNSKDRVEAMVQIGIDICNTLSEIERNELENIDDEKLQEIAAIRLGLEAFMVTL